MVSRIYIATNADCTVSTSPSIYANFHSVAANDWCGQLGSEQVVTQTMLTFTPGELSTIAGPLTRTFEPQFPYRAFSTKRFNFADLPCPPQSVMVISPKLSCIQVD
jgi:hypothetical protein